MGELDQPMPPTISRERGLEWRDADMDVAKNTHTHTHREREREREKLEEEEEEGSLNDQLSSSNQIL